MNKNLNKAKAIKNDEFYTQLSDIENELKHYKRHFKNKIVYCNCDDPYESNFFKYFVLNFNHLKLRKLIATSYTYSNIVGNEVCVIDIKSLIEETKSFKIEINKMEDVNGDGRVDLSDIEYLLKNDANICTPLRGGGDFRSPECVEILRECDIVVTNPPFSLFREYVAQLIEYEKKFLIIGSMGAVTYKNIFPLIKDNKMWLGVSPRSMDFRTPDNTLVNVNSVWYTNLEHTKRNDHLILYKTYNETEYPKYDNYDAIEVSNTKDIPKDYEGIMGVPITFLDKYNPEQFEIIGLSASAGYNKQIVGIPFKGEKDARTLIDGKNTYSRVFIRHKNNTGETS